MAGATRSSTRGGIRARTRALLLDAAIRVFARKGVGATAIHEITAEAGVANGTFYNYFRTREEIAEAASERLAERLQAEVSESYRAVDDPAERLAIGCRRFILKALRDPQWGAASLRVWTSRRGLSDRLAQPVLADLRAGRRRKLFQYSNEGAALDLVCGAVQSAMNTVIARKAGEEHAEAVVAHILRALGIAAGEAAEISRRALPPEPAPS
jgi:AcrR family transcriptional regulator